WRALVMRQDEHRRVIGRVLSPPAVPRFVGPRPPYRAEHVATHDPGPDAGHGPGSELFVDVGVSTPGSTAAVCSFEGGSVHEPVVQAFAADTERFLTRLARAGAVSIE